MEMDYRLKTEGYNRVIIVIKVRWIVGVGRYRGRRRR